MSMRATAVMTAAIAAIGGTNVPAQATGEPRDATLQFVASNSPLAGISYGIDAVDGSTLLFDQRTSTRLAAGRRTVWYSCPNEPVSRDGSRMTFDFEPGERYELACRNGKPAQIRIAKDC